MDKYLEQLINDLHTLYHQNREVKRFDNVNAELAEVDRAITENPQQTMAAIIGLDPGIFPPGDKLTKEQTVRLTRAILGLWKYYFIEAVYPENFPLERLYPLLVAKFSDPDFMYIGCIPGGTTYVEFCNYDPTHCPFGREYCSTCWDNDPLLAE